MVSKTDMNSCSRCWFISMTCGSGDGHRSTDWEKTMARFSECIRVASADFASVCKNWTRKETAAWCSGASDSTSERTASGPSSAAARARSYSGTSGSASSRSSSLSVAPYACGLAMVSMSLPALSALVRAASESGSAGTRKIPSVCSPPFAMTCSASQCISSSTVYPPATRSPRHAPKGDGASGAAANFLSCSGVVVGATTLRESRAHVLIMRVPYRAYWPMGSGDEWRAAQ
mmetsp:Transcript_16456/g.51462  ORF Transcript_16456/g.51462 Transcript_16456/m.51462 type:complete len:232 (-) Transcript_16456:1474-2169(-)